MKRVLVAVLIAMVGTAVAAPPCWACECVPGITKKEQAKNADVIFTGRVLEVTDVSVESDELKIRFRVGKAYKGHPRRITNVYTAESGSLCGYSFEEDQRYTVFARRSGDQKTTNSCSGTKAGRINPDNYGLPEGYPPKD